MDETDRELSREELLDRYKKQVAPSTDVTTRRSPFKFLDSYDVGDSDIFFGRDSEIEELLRYYHSLGHVLIYGESGAGKTSLVQCGLRATIPEADALFIPLRIRAEGLPGVCRDICESASQQLGETVAYSAEMSLIATLMETREAASRPVVLFFDQFEELLILHSADARRRFAEELAKIPRARINVKVIIGIRQDFLAQLSELEATLEGLFDNRFWLRRMSRENAAQAVVQACSTCDVKIDVPLAASIIQRLDTTGQGIELPYLQVVMDRLYGQAVEANPDQPVISADDVEKLGDVAQILGNFLTDEVEKLSAPDNGRQILKAFVSREGTRRTLTREVVAQEAAGFGNAIPPAELDAILSQLVKVRILRENVEAGIFELRHDTLAATVFSWISEVEKELIEVRDNLVNRFNEYQARNRPKSALLDQGFMDYVSVYKHRLKPLLNQPQRAYLTSSERELGRRKRVKQLSIFGGILSVILVAFLFGAGIMWTRMKAAERVAEAERQKFEEARKTVDRFFVSVSEDTLLSQPGMQDLRKTLLRDAGDFFQAYLADLAEAVGDEPDENLLADVARTNYYLGQLNELIEGEEAALKRYHEAQKGQEDLALQMPDDEELLNELGNTWNAIGRANDNLKRRNQAINAYEEALELRDKLAKRFPQDAELQRKHASTIMNIGLVKRDEALEKAERFSSDRDNQELKDEVVPICEDVIVQIKTAQEIRTAGETALQTQNPVPEQDLETLYRIRRDKAMGAWNLAKFEQDLDDKGLRENYAGYSNAVGYYKSASEICESLLGLSEANNLAQRSAKPNDLEIQYVLGESYLGLGYVEELYPLREENLFKAKQTLERLAYFNPDVIKFQGAVGRVEFYFGVCYDGWANYLMQNPGKTLADERTTHREKALELRKNAVVAFRKAKEQFAKNKEHQQDQIKSEELCDRAQTKLDDLNNSPEP